MNTQHRFGGPWTQLKLDVLRKYLVFYNTALKNKGFKRIYIDAFAGTGECEISGADESENIAGSASIAIEIDPPFDELVFIEANKGRFRELERLCQGQSARACRLYNAEANARIRALCREEDWSNTRAVMFLDPYGLSVEWQTLEEVANTKAIDVWYLFSLSGFYRQAARRLDAVDNGKAARLDLCLGTHEWRSVLYEEPRQPDMWGNGPDQIREVGVPEMEAFVRGRLKKIFPTVCEPLHLPAKGAPLYALYFAVSNPSKSAVGLALKGANHILKQSTTSG